MSNTFINKNYVALLISFVVLVVVIGITAVFMQKAELLKTTALLQQGDGMLPSAGGGSGGPQQIEGVGSPPPPGISYVPGRVGAAVSVNVEYSDTNRTEPSPFSADVHSSPGGIECSTLMTLTVPVPQEENEDNDVEKYWAPTATGTCAARFDENNNVILALTGAPSFIDPQKSGWACFGEFTQWMEPGGPDGGGAGGGAPNLQEATGISITLSPQWLQQNPRTDCTVTLADA